MRAVVVGGSGQIGGWLLRILERRGHEASGTYCSVAYPGLTRVDGADLPGAAAWLRSRRPDVVFFPAGFTYVDGCQRDPARARAANLDQPLNLARVAADLGARLVYFSTDYVFDGTSGPNAEADPTHPINVYGQAKLEAEHALFDALGDALLIARTSWVFGPERQGKNFAYQLVRTLREGRPLVCPTDQASNPSYGPDVAEAVVSLVEQGHSGLLHVAGPEVLPRDQFARTLAEGFGLDAGLIVGKSTEELGQETPRPLRGGLQTGRLESILPGTMRPLDRAIADFHARVAATDGWADPASR
jgi:dTDP-4-dehydrorhamnose reductase